ncbi:MAG: ATP-binding cassette domain-containing protein [Flammeovirgaceae bacterium]|nr:ATP-binding cassette domain-containing protein [Flammeovirgaceae bacterium]
MIEVQNISKSFGDKQILKSVSGTFEKGKSNLIIGASGTGKSVLLKCIVELVIPDEGIVTYDKRNFTQGDKKLKTAVRRDIGMLFQGGALFDSMTVGENVRFPLELLAIMPKDEKDDRVNFCLQRVGLKNANKKMPSELSGGMRKRVGIARAIVNNPKYLFCDEPNSGLDPQTSILIDDLIEDITEDYDMTTVVVTHDMNSVIGIGHKIIFIYQGQKLWEGSKDEITHSGVKELDDFVFANKAMNSLREK